MLENFREYLFVNKIPATAAAVSIGTITKEFVTSIVLDLLIPVVLLVVKFMAPVAWRPRVQFIEGNAGDFNIRRVVEMTAIWVSVLAISYILLEYVVQRGVIGVRTRMSTKERAAFQHAALHSASIGPWS